MMILAWISATFGFTMSFRGAVDIILRLTIYLMLTSALALLRYDERRCLMFSLVYVLAPFPSLVALSSILAGKAALVWLTMGFVLLLFIIG